LVVRQAVDEHVLDDPAGRGQLRRRGEGPVGDLAKNEG
jgi:hypothetical protein